MVYDSVFTTLWGEDPDKYLDDIDSDFSIFFCVVYEAFFCGCIILNYNVYHIFIIIGSFIYSGYG